MAYAGADEADLAFSWLERAFEQRPPELIYLKVRPDLGSLRSDPRFTDLLERMGLG